MIKMYEETAVESYRNCIELLQEANLLLENDRKERAYALAVLSVEEFAKSFLFKCKSVGIITDPKFMNDIRKHEEKIFHFTHVITTNYQLAPRLEEIMRALQHDANKPHNKHIFPTVLFNAMVSTLPRLDEAIRVLKELDKWKLKSFYVDISRGRVLTPRNQISKKRCEDLFHILNGYVDGFEIILGANDQKFLSIVDWLDPQVKSGTMKSDMKKSN